VPFFAPLNPIAPLDAQATVSPLVVLIVIIVLLNVDCICAIPLGAVFFCFFTDVLFYLSSHSSFFYLLSVFNIY